MELVSLGPDFGVEVRGIALVDVASSDKAYQSVRAAFEQHSVLLFRDQEITDDVQAAFSRAFGPLERVKVGSEGVGTFYSRLHNIAPDSSLVPETHRQALAARANQLWHTDSSFRRHRHSHRCCRHASFLGTAVTQSLPPRERPGAACRLPCSHDCATPS